MAQNDVHRLNCPLMCLIPEYTNTSILLGVRPENRFCAIHRGIINNNYFKALESLDQYALNRLANILFTIKGTKYDTDDWLGHPLPLLAAMHYVHGSTLLFT
jgi:hypothetical protein